MVDLTGITQEALLQAHRIAAIPSVWMQYVAMMLTLFISGLLVARKSGKFWAIFFLTLIVGAIIATGISAMPNVVQTIAELFSVE